MKSPNNNEPTPSTQRTVGVFTIAVLMILSGIFGYGIAVGLPKLEPPSPTPPATIRTPIVSMFVTWNVNQSISDKYFSWTHEIVLLVSDQSGGEFSGIVVSSPVMECSGLTCTVQITPSPFYNLGYRTGWNMTLIYSTGRAVPNIAAYIMPAQRSSSPWCTGWTTPILESLCVSIVTTST